MSAPPRKLHDKPCQACILMDRTRIDILDHEAEGDVTAVPYHNILPRKRKILRPDRIFQFQSCIGLILHIHKQLLHTSVFLPGLLVPGIAVHDTDFGVTDIAVQWITDVMILPIPFFVSKIFPAVTDLPPITVMIRNAFPDTVSCDPFRPCLCSPTQCMEIPGRIPAVGG